MEPVNDIESMNQLNEFLESEKHINKNEPWNKLNKTIKKQKLHVFAEKYGKEKSIPIKTVKMLKSFFLDCLEKNKLQRTKDVIYDKDTEEIQSIPALMFNQTTKNFTLRQLEKRDSTIKSLTPKRITAKNTVQENDGKKEKKIELKISQEESI